MFTNYGIESIALAIPKYAFPLKDLADLRNVDPMKYEEGLGCKMMALTLDDENVVDLAVRAAQRAIERWDGNLDQIKMIAVGTESSVDESRPLSAFIAEKLDLKGNIRSYEVKHACYGGTLAIRQALEWKLSGTTEDDDVALVIACDTCYYAPSHPAEATQGAGAIAMIIGKNKLLSFSRQSVPYSAPAYDFYRPFGNDFPQVDGKLSLDSYMLASEQCYSKFLKNYKDVLDYKALCFHVPFPKMIKKAFFNLGSKAHMSEDEIQKLYQEKVQPFKEWNSIVGNAYSASLWISVASALDKLKKDDKLLAFSYGSGFGAELQALKVEYDSFDAISKDFSKDIKDREIITKDMYTQWQQNKPRRRGIPTG